MRAKTHIAYSVAFHRPACPILQAVLECVQMTKAMHRLNKGRYR